MFVDACALEKSFTVAVFCASVHFPVSSSATSSSASLPSSFDPSPISIYLSPSTVLPQRKKKGEKKKKENAHTFLPITIPHAKPRLLIPIRRLAALLELVVAAPLPRRLKVGERVAVHAEHPLPVPALRDGARGEPPQLPREALQVVRLPEEQRVPRDQVREVVADEVRGGGGRRCQEGESGAESPEGGGEHGRGGGQVGR